MTGRLARVTLALACLLAVRTAAAQCAAGGYPTGQSCGLTGDTHQGCCEGVSTLRWCENGVVCVKNCAENPTNNCCEYSSQPGCCNTQVMQAVCSQAPKCCSGPWDGGCIAIATVLFDVPCPEQPPPCDANYGLCGWDSAKSFYNCSPVHEADPSGTYPLQCGGGCTPQCAGKQCGSDGCGGSCGACGAGQGCVSGLCQAQCTGDCVGKQCGDDGCGGSCGSCPPGAACTEGSCSACQPACSAKSCGDDGCGGTCGACDPWETCQSGTCVLTRTCEPACDGLACGDDGCGGSCGSCDPWETCQEGQCTPSETCTQQCGGRQCGDDGCGGSCGQCLSGEVCNSAGRCVTPGVPVDPIDDQDSSAQEPAACQSGGRAAPMAGWLILLVLGGLWRRRRLRV